MACAKWGANLKVRIAPPVVARESLHCHALTVTVTLVTAITVFKIYRHLHRRLHGEGSACDTSGIPTGSCVSSGPLPEALSLRVLCHSESMGCSVRCTVVIAAVDCTQKAAHATRHEQATSARVTSRSIQTRWEKTLPHRKTPAKQSRSGQMRQEQIMPLQKTQAAMNSLNTG